MARNLDALLQPLPKVPEPGLDALDPRFSAITSLAARGQYSVAADLVESLLVEEIFDLRLLVIFLFQVFREGGLLGLPDVLAAVVSLLGDNFEALGPAKKREETTDRRLAWLFGEITDTLEYHASKQTPEWSEFRRGSTHETMPAILAGMAAVADVLASRRFTLAPRGLGRIEGWLAKYGNLVSPPEAPEDPGPGEANGPSAEAALSSDGSFAVQVMPIQGTQPMRYEITLPVSHRFVEFTAKLRAFEQLVQKQDFRKAALVAEDLQRLIENFDPRLYFPEVFSGFSALFAENIGPLSEHLDERESVAWKALRQFYQTDLDRFVRGERRL